MPTLAEVIRYVEKEFPAAIWLVRKDEAKGFFGNIVLNPLADGPTFPIFADTPELALSKSLAKARSWLRAHG